MTTFVKRLRGKLKLKQCEMAHLLYVTPGALHNYEKGYRHPKPKTAYRIIELAKTYGFHVELEDLYPRV